MNTRVNKLSVTEAQLSEMSPAEKEKLEKLKEIGRKMKDVNNIYTTGVKMKDTVLMAGARQKLAQLAKMKHDLEIQVVDEEEIDSVRAKPVSGPGATSLDEAKSGPIKNHVWLGKKVKTPDGVGTVTSVERNPTFSQMVPWVTAVWVKFPGKEYAKEYRKDDVRPVKTNAPVTEASKDKNKEEGTYTVVFSSDQKPYSYGKFWAKSKEDAKKRAKDIFKKHGFTNVNVRELAIKESIEEDNIGGIQAKRVSGPGATVGQVDEMFADQGAGSDATGEEDNDKIVRRFAVTVIDPNASAVSQRKEKIQKTIRIRGGDEVDAENRAVDYYVGRGYKVIDAWFIDEVDGLKESEGYFPPKPKPDMRGRKEYDEHGREVKRSLKGKLKEDASAGASSSASIATVVAGGPGIIKRTNSKKKKGRYGNSVSPKTFNNAVSKGIYEAILSESPSKKAITRRSKVEKLDKNRRRTHETR